MRFDQNPYNQILTASPSHGGDDFAAAESEVLLNESAAEVDVDRIIASINSSQVEVEYIPGRCFTAIFHGAELLSFNKLLNLDHRTGELHRYRAACLKAAERAVYTAEQLFECRRPELSERISVSLYRAGVKAFDNDELIAAYKLLIDGFREVGLLKENDPSHISSFDCLLQRCGVNEAVSIGITFRRA